MKAEATAPSGAYGPSNGERAGAPTHLALPRDWEVDHSDGWARGEPMWAGSQLPGRTMAGMVKVGRSGQGGRACGRASRPMGWYPFHRGPAADTAPWDGASPEMRVEGHVLRLRHALESIRWSL
jgi:hypothetical protein